MKRLAATLALAPTLAIACNKMPTQPEPLADCTILGVVVPPVLEIGQTTRLSAFLEHCRPMYLPLGPETVIWQSFDPGVASVNGDSVTAVARGPAVIQGTYGNMTQQALVVVGSNVSQPPAVPARLRIFGAPSMTVHQRAAFGAFVVMTDGTVGRVSSAATWSSADPSIAGISGLSGVTGEDRAVDAFAQGTARISALFQGFSVTASTQVHQN